MLFELGISISPIYLATLIVLHFSQYRKIETDNCGRTLDARIFILWMEMINLMLHLAICDKSLNDIEQMEKYLENIKFFNFDYEVFENAKELYKYQTQHHENFDIYILSIELEDMLGLEVARKLREDSQEALIIFVSNDAKCVFDVFEVFTFAFLLKPLTYNKFSTTLYNAFNYLYRTKRLFLFSYRKCNYSILCQSILYIEKLGRKAFIHTTDARVYQCNITLEKIWEQLNPSKFAAIHISCIVNLTEIASIKCDQLKLKNNEVLYVAKKYRQEIKSRHLQNLKIKKL